jgi:hypothetical protein
MVKALAALLLTGMLWPGHSLRAQSIISESGRLVFYNSIDSAQGATILRLIFLVRCWLDTYDPRDSFPVLLDLRPPDSAVSDSTASASPTTDSIPPRSPHPDSAAYELGYDNLFGNSLSYTDSSAIPTDPGQQLYYKRLGLRIRASKTDPKSLLHLLEYGVTHYPFLQQMRANWLFDDPAHHPIATTLSPEDIRTILNHPVSPHIRSALRTCWP